MWERPEVGLENINILLGALDKLVQKVIRLLACFSVDEHRNLPTV